MRLKWVFFINVLLLLLAAWGFIPIYSFAMHVANVIKGESTGEWINITPTIIFLFICIGVGILMYRHNAKKHKRMLLKLFMPAEFSEQDEREKMINAHACRKVYLSMPLIFGIILFLMGLYPFLADTFPSYPMLLLFIFPIAQITIYYLSVRNKF